MIGERAESRDLVSYGLDVALRCHQRVYEGGLRVPFYVSWPGRLPAGASIPVMANYTDVLPTLLDLAKITPASWEKPVDGRSLAPLLRDQDKAEWSPRHFFMHFLRPGREAILAD